MCQDKIVPSNYDPAKTTTKPGNVPVEPGQGYPGQGYRFLEAHEYIKPGDQFYSAESESWKTTRFAVETRQSSGLRYRRQTTISAPSRDPIIADDSGYRVLAYRILGPGEKVQPGDEYLAHHDGQWRALSVVPGDGTQPKGYKYRRSIPVPPEPAPKPQPASKDETVYLHVWADGIKQNMAGQRGPVVLVRCSSDLRTCFVVHEARFKGNAKLVFRPDLDKRLPGFDGRVMSWVEVKAKDLKVIHRPKIAPMSFVKFHKAALDGKIHVKRIEIYQGKE